MMEDEKNQRFHKNNKSKTIKGVRLIIFVSTVIHNNFGISVLRITENGQFFSVKLKEYVAIF